MGWLMGIEPTTTGHKRFCGADLVVMPIEFMERLGMTPDHDSLLDYVSLACWRGLVKRPQPVSAYQWRLDNSLAGADLADRLPVFGSLPVARLG